MQQTTHYNLKKPADNDYADIAALSEDMDIIDTTMYGKIDATEKGQADGVATLGSDGKLPAAQKPAYTASEVGAVPTTRAVNGKSLFADVTLTGDDIKTSASDETTISSQLSNAAQSTLGQVPDVDLLAWADAQPRTGAFGINPAVTTEGVPAVGWYHGFLEVKQSGRRLTLTESSGGNRTWINATSSNQWTGWKQLAFAADLASKAETVTGVYTGDGAESRTINLGFKPKAVLVLYEGRVIWNYDVYGGLVFEGYPTKSGEYVALEVASNGFIVHTNGNGCSTNDNNREYHYIAFK